ncbi:hypothetical protein MLD38_000426 [Melastoma candidum]|uniref:Uncharacterized protein n=1 Tax=Melastoma candidum TaxID=119954 RepID=A0ACB9SAZ3_9MYRT|nr:hypothetical protein MLD38_000426 [Melastoma candidum]
MLCSRPSAKDIRWPRGGSNDVDDDSLSPKVGCMGQVKRNNRVVGFPTPGSRSFPVSTSRHTSKQTRVVKRMFSSKCLASASVSKQAVPPELSSCRAARSSARRTESRRIICKEEKVATPAALVSVIDMDPPLPVTRMSSKDMEREGGNLWKRRSGGMGLKRLELTSSNAAVLSHLDKGDKSWLSQA